MKLKGRGERIYEIIGWSLMSLAKIQTGTLLIDSSKTVLKEQEI